MLGHQAPPIIGDWASIFGGSKAQKLKGPTGEPIFPNGGAPPVEEA